MKWLICAVACLTALAAQAGDIEISKPWVRASIGTAANTAGYLTITNTGSEPDWLIGASTPDAAIATVHNSVMAGDVMKMEAVRRLEIPPGGSVTFAPRGLHIMIMRVAGTLPPGARVPLVLTFERAGKVEVTAPVLPISAAGPE